MNAVTTIEPTQRKSVIAAIASRYHMEAAAFEATVRATCSPIGNNARALTREEFAAFAVVAYEYRLNPLTREIYAFPKKGGGIVPIVSIDGWISLVNSHQSCDGFEFEEHHDEKAGLVSMTCRIYRKDRARPVAITEYLAECIRETEPWKMRHRMLRHKAMIQAARYAFGFSGIYDEEEGRVIAEAGDGGRIGDTPPPAPPAPALPLPPPGPPAEDATFDELPPSPPAPPSPAEVAAVDLDPTNPAKVLKQAEADFAMVDDIDRMNALWDFRYQAIADEMLPPDAEDLMGVFRRHERRVAP